MAFFRRKTRPEPPAESPQNTIIQFETEFAGADEAAQNEPALAQQDSVLAASSAYVAGLRGQAGASPDSGALYASALRDHANLIAERGAAEDAIPVLRVALEAARALPDPRGDAVRLQLQILKDLSTLAESTRDAETQRKAVEEAVALARGLHAKDPVGATPILADLLLELSVVQSGPTPDETLLAPVEEAIALLNEAEGVEEERRAKLSHQAVYMRGRMLLALGREDEGFATLLEAISVGRRLVEINPGRYEMPFLSLTYEVFEMASAFGDYEKAQKAMEMRLQLLAEAKPYTHVWPGLIDGHLELATMWVGSAGDRVRRNEADTDRIVAAEIERGRAALDALEALAKETAEDDPEQGAAAMVQVYRYRAKADAVVGDDEALHRNLEQAIKIGRPFARKEGSPVLFPLSSVYAERAGLRHMSEDPELPLADSAEALEIARVIFAPKLAAYRAGTSDFGDGVNEWITAASSLTHHADLLVWFSREEEALPLVREAWDMWQHMWKAAQVDQALTQHLWFIDENMEQCRSLYHRIQEPSESDGE